MPVGFENPIPVNGKSYRQLIVSAVWLLLFIETFSFPLALAAPEFPVLSGRVVDEANILDATIEARLTSILRQHEQETSNQVVVVTVSSLQGYDIAEYGVDLGRHWAIGQAEKDNGVLFIIAPNERKTRIEVGYGLEGTLTDALSKRIIERKVIPAFKQGNFSKGIEAGTLAILAALGGEVMPDDSIPTSTPNSPDKGNFNALVIAFVIFIFVGSFIRALLGLIFSLPIVLIGSALVGWMLTQSIAIGILLGVFAAFFHFFNWGSGGGSSGGGGYSGGSGFSSSSFSGGGGSFGGGGASGSW